MVLRRWGSATRKFGLSTELINQIFKYNNVLLIGYFKQAQSQSQCETSLNPFPSPHIKGRVGKIFLSSISTLLMIFCSLYPSHPKISMYILHTVPVFEFPVKYNSLLKDRLILKVSALVATILARTGIIPIVMNLLTGKSMQNRSSRSARPPSVILPSDGGGLQIRVYNQMMPYRPPLFIDSWRDATDGRGQSKESKNPIKKGKRVAAGKKQPFQWSRYSRSHVVNEAISNSDILNWIKCMKLKTFNKVLSGDEILKEKGFFL